MSALAYERLPGRRRTLISSTSLYAGPDHLLLLQSNRLSEEYQRFYFQDIQGIVLRRTAPFHYVWAALFVLVALLAARISGDALWPLGIFTAGALFLWMRGPSCDVRLRTAVTSTRLASLHRLKTAVRVLPRIRDHIEAVQGRVLSAPENYATEAAPVPPTFPVEGPQPSAPRGRDHVYLFAFIALEAILLAVWLQVRSDWLQSALPVLTLMEFLALVIVMLRQARQRVPTLLRNMTFAAMGRWFLVHLFSSGMAYKVIVVDRVKGTLDPLTIMRGTMSYITLATLVATAATGLWLSLRNYDE